PVPRSPHGSWCVDRERPADRPGRPDPPLAGLARWLWLRGFPASQFWERSPTVPSPTLEVMPPPRAGPPTEEGPPPSGLENRGRRASGDGGSALSARPRGPPHSYS